MWLIVGLGNPGIRYKWNRHNIGFHVIDLISKTYDIKLKKDKLVSALLGMGKINGEEVILAKPAAYMNRSGTIIERLVELYGLPIQKILVISDDIDLPWNKLRVKKHGGSAGHKGVESMITELGTTNFPRIRMGVGRPASSGGNNIVEHVLGNFDTEEKKELTNYCKKAIDVVYTILNNNIDIAMNKFN